MDLIDPALLPVRENEPAPSEPGKRDPRSRRERLRERMAPLRSRIKRLRMAARRRAFEARATLRSSAALAGISRDARTLTKDAHQVGHKVAVGVRERLPSQTATAAGLRKDLGAIRREFDAFGNQLVLDVEKGAARTKRALLRSHFVSGLAIDSQRMAKRVRQGRHNRGPRSAH